LSTDFNGEAWTTAELLTEVYRECRMPDTGTVDYTPLVVLREATDAIRNFAQHTIAQAREGRLATALLRAAPADARDTYDRDYELPPLSVGDTIDGVDWVQGTSSWPLTPIPIGLESTFYSRPDARGVPAMYGLLDGLIRIFPTPEAAGTVRVTYQRRHGQLSTTDSVAIASFAANGTSTDVTVVGAVPSSIVLNAWVDVFGRYHPHRTKIHGAQVTNVAGLVVRVNVPSSVFTDWAATGDTLALYGKTPFVHLPQEMRKPLTQHIASIILEQIGDPSAMAKEARAERGQARVKEQLQPRTKAQRPKAFNPNSIFRQGSRRRAWWQD
jgi:hypothetical protein